MIGQTQRTTVRQQHAQSLSQVAHRIEQSNWLELNNEDLEEELRRKRDDLFLRRQVSRHSNVTPNRSKSDRHSAMLHNQCRSGVRLSRTSHAGNLLGTESRRSENRADSPVLREHVLSQLRDANIDGLCINFEFAEFLINDCIDRFGMLLEPLETVVDLFSELGGTCDLPQAEIALDHLQHLDPVGFGARNEEERLRLLVDRVAEDPELADQFDPPLKHLDELRRLVGDLEMLKRINHQQSSSVSETAERAGLSEEMLVESLSELKRILNWNPFDGYLFGAAETLAPDIVFQVIGGDISYEVCSVGFVKVTLPSACRSDNAAKRWVNQSSGLNQSSQVAAAINGRMEILDRIALALVELQGDFIRQGELSLRPLLQQELAGIIGRDVSTVSRALKDKRIQTPHGMFPLGICFPKPLKAGSDVTEHQFQRFVAGVIEEEPGDAPLTDEQIRVEAQRRLGIMLARETVKKYRRQANLPNSRQRRVGYLKKTA